MTVIKVKSKSKVATLLRFGGSVNWSQHYNESTAEYAGEKKIKLVSIRESYKQVGGLFKSLDLYQLFYCKFNVESASDRKFKIG